MRSPSTTRTQKQFRNIAMRHKKVVLAHIEKLAGEMGAAEPEVLAHQLALLIDGAIVAAMVSRNPGVADTAGLAAGSSVRAVEGEEAETRERRSRAARGGVQASALVAVGKRSVPTIAARREWWARR